jgi:hypothetical protein
MSPDQIAAEIERLKGKLASAQEGAILARRRDEARAAEWADGIISDRFPDAEMEVVARVLLRLLDEKFPPIKDA